MRNHLFIWFIPILFGIILIGCQDKLDINNPVADQKTTLEKSGRPAIENLISDVSVSGTGVLTAGAGCEPNGTGTINLNVPAGYTINKVYLYWAGRHRVPDGDNEIKVNSIPIQGQLIGKAAIDNPRVTYSYRADITALNLVKIGNNSLNITDFNAIGWPDTNRPNGAGVIVIYSDGTNNSDIEIRDGADFTFILEGDPNNQNFTNEQIFTFPSASVNRVANLDIFAADVAFDETYPSIIRPHYLEYKIGSGPKVRIDNPFGDTDGEKWDTYRLNLNIPAGVTQVSVQIFSGPGGPFSRPFPASLYWVSATLTVPKVPVLAEVGDRIWKDINQNGIQDPGEEGFPGVLLCLYKCDGTWLNICTETDANGNYFFKGLQPGSYKIRMNIPDGWTLSPTNVGSNDKVDSDFSTNNAGETYTECFDLDPGESDSTWDGGLYQPTLLGQLGDRVWVDNAPGKNCNGIQDPGEPGIAGITVNLYKCSAPTVIFKTTTTNSTGNYLFTDLPADCYFVKFVKPAGYTFAPKNQGGDIQFDSDADPSTGATSNINLAAGQIDKSWDAGLCPEEPCEPCEGGVNEITIKQLVPGTVTFAGLAANDIVTSDPPFYNIKNRLGQRIQSDFKVYINGQLNTTIHTSCSQPVDPGLVYGDFEIIFSRSIIGGPICPPDCNFQEIEFKFDKDKIRWKIKNAGLGSLVVKEIYITWPENINGQLEKIRLNGDAYSGPASSPLKVGEKNWLGSNLKPRWIKPGATETLEFDFKKNVSKDKSKYSIRVVFYGSNCELVFTPGSTGSTNCTARITATLLRYTGPDRGVVTVKFQGKDGGLATYSNVNLTTGTILQTGDWTVSAIPGNLGTVMSIYINGVLHEAHHTSCSAPYVVGNPAPLDASSPGNPPKGTPSPNWSIVNFKDADDPVLRDALEE